MTTPQSEPEQSTPLDWDARTVAEVLHGAIAVAAYHAKQYPDQVSAVISAVLRDLDEVEREWLAQLAGVFQRRHGRFHDQGWCRCDHGSEQNGEPQCHA